MIEANELRRGNLIEFEGMISIVKEIDEQGVVVDIKDTGETEWIDLFQFTPIGITEDILIKSGFSILKEFSSGINYGYVVDGSYDNGLSFIKWNKENKLECTRKHIKSLHQLQNLVYFSTNQELQIKL